MKIGGVFERFAKSKTGQKVYNWACNPKNDKFLNNNLPQVETVLSTACYVWSTEKQKNIQRDQKNLLQIQNVGSGLVGLGVAGAANRQVGKWGEAIIKDLDPTKVDPKSIRQISTGIRMGLPILTTAVCMRFLIPSALAGISGLVMDKNREGKNKNKDKLDIQA